MRANVSRHRAYGAREAQVFLDRLLPAAPDVVVQVAHLAGAGAGDDPGADSVMAVLAHAVSVHDPRTRNLWFDISGVTDDRISEAERVRIVRRIREVGIDRILYGSDSPTGGNLVPRDAWAAVQHLPLTRSELTKIARNVAPYLR
jgi:predicted TIM-barrel fold metal-dependent hydrolase